MGVTKAVGDRFGKGGIADRMIWLNGFPFLDNKEEQMFGVPVSTVMTKQLTVIPASAFTLKELERVLAENQFQGFPVVEGHQHSRVLVGYIGRTEIKYTIERAKREQSVLPNARCFFDTANPDGGGLVAAATTTTTTATTPAISFDTIPTTSGQMSIDFSRFINPTPLTVHPHLPLETVLEVFKKLGPRVILVEHRGQLRGLVTVKDCLKYQFTVEALENPRDDSLLLSHERRLWQWILFVVGVLKGRTWTRARGGRGRGGEGGSRGRHIRLTSSSSNFATSGDTRSSTAMGHGRPPGPMTPRSTLDGMVNEEDDIYDHGLELEHR